MGKRLFYVLISAYVFLFATQQTFATCVTPSLTSVTTNGPVCAGSTLNLNANGPANVTDYSWTGPNGFTSTLQNPAIPSVTTAASGIYTVMVTNNAGGGCTASYTVNATVNTSPLATYAASPTTACVGSAVTFTALNSIASSGTWCNPVLASFGTGSYFTVNNDDFDYIPIPLIFTLEATIQWNGGDGYIFYNGVYPYDGYGLHITATGDIYWYVSGAGDYITAATNITPGEVHHIAFIERSNVWVFYMDGVLLGAQNIGAPPTITENLTIGSIDASSPSSSFNGVIENVSVWNYERSPAQLRNDVDSCSFAPEFSLVAFWPLNDGIGSTTVHDASGNGHDLLMSNIAWSTVGDNTYSWSFGDGAVSTVFGAVHSYTATGTYTSTLTVTSNTTGCSATSVGSPVSVFAVPTIGGISTSPVCAGATLGLNANSSSGVTDYSWAGPNGFSSAAQNPTITTASTAATGLYSLTVSNSTTGCSSAYTAAATVNPAPALSNATVSATTPCLGSVLNLQANAPANVAGYTWSGPNGFTSTLQNPAKSGLAYADSGAYTVTVNNGTAPGCSATYATPHVQVISTPVIGTINGDKNVCTGGVTSLSDTTAGGSWFSSDESIATIDPTGLVTGLSSGMITVGYAASNICGINLKFATVNVTTAPAAISGANNVCIGASVSLSDATTGGTWSSSNTAVGSVDGSGNVRGIAAGTTTITYTAGCSVTMIVTVNGPSSAGTITGTNSTCPGSTISLSDAISGGIWSSSNTAVGTVDASGNVRGITSGTTTISYMVSGGCGSATATNIITVTATPYAGPIAGTTSVCPGSATALTDAITGGTWSSSNAAVGTVDGSGNVTGIGAGTTTISYTITGSCSSATATDIVTVSALPNAGTIMGTASVCAAATISLTDAVTGGVWSSNNTAAGTVDGFGNVTGIAAGTTTISYTITTVCGIASVTAIVSVNPSSNAGTITGLALVCTGSNIVLSDTVTGGEWSSSNGNASVVNGTVSGLAAGTSTISYTVTTGCGSAIMTIIVTVNTTSAGSITGASGVATGTNITLTDATGGGAWSATNGNATVSGGVVTGVMPGLDTIIYSVSGSCGMATASREISVYASVPGITGNPVFCSGSTTALTDIATGGTWSSSNTTIATVGSTGIVSGLMAGTANISYTQGGSAAILAVTVKATPTPIQGSAYECAGTTIILTDATAGGTWSATGLTVTGSGTAATITAGATAGSGTVTYTSGNGCSTIYPNTIYPNPLPITGNTYVCTGSQTILTDATTGGILWSSGNTAVATVSGGTITGVSWGTASITYKILTGSCIATTIVTVTNTVTPISGNSAVCAGATTTLSNAAGAGTWSSSNSSVATAGSGTGIVTGVSSGTATITYTPAAGGCRSTVVATVNAAAPIQGSTSLCGGSHITLSDVSAGGTWTSDNTGIASIGSSTGVVTGVSNGSATISYTLASGCVRTVVVNVTGSLMAISGNTVLCAGTNSALTDATPGGTWSISGGLVATIGSTGLVTASTTYTGTATVSYTATGCMVTTVITVNANPKPIQGVTSECAGIMVTLTDVTAGGSWSGSGNISVATLGTNSGTVTGGATAGTGSVTYTLPTGCFATYPNTVYANPSAILGNFTVCAGATTVLSDATPGAISWTSSNSSVATAINSGEVTGVSAGTVVITYKILTGSCYTTKVITVNPAPVVTVISGPSSISHATPVTLSDVTTGGVWTSSNSGVILLSGSTGTTVTATAVTTSGSATISYTVIDVNGCRSSATKTISNTARYASGINTIQEEENILLYPNPTNGTVNIKADVAGAFYMYALDGKLLSEYKIIEGITSITLPNDLAKGIYMGKYVGSDGNIMLFKIVKE